MRQLYDAIAVWDANTRSLTAGKTNKNIREFNLNFLHLLHQASQQPKTHTILQDVFGLSEQATRTIQAMSPDKLRDLASDLLLIFALDTDDAVILRAFEQGYDEQIYLDTRMPPQEFDTAYWLLLNKEATQDPLQASVVFGVSLDIARVVAEASDAQLRSLRPEEPLRFKLRFKEDLFQVSDDELSGISFLQRTQQAFD